MKFKKIATLAVAGAMVLSGCTQQPSEPTGSAEPTQNNTYSIVASTFYEYDWVMEVLGEQKDNFDVTLLMNSGVDLHSYAPTAEDIVTIKSADLFVYNGGHSHAWVADVVAEPINENFQTVNVVERLGDAVKAEESVEGMQSGGHHHGGEEGTGMAPHDYEYDEEKYDYYTSCCYADNFDIDENGTVLGFTNPETGVYTEYCCEHDGFVFDGDNLLGILVEKEHNHEDCTDETCDHDHEEDAHEHDHEEDAHEHDHEEDAHEHNHEEDAHEHDHAGHGHDDEHVWLSLHNAMTVCEVLAEEIGVIDTENADAYKANANAYIEKLSALDQGYKDAVAEAEKDTLVFADRFPFLYLMDDYGINYYAAFQGCSAETEASFETVMFLAEKVDELDIDQLLIIDNGLVELAETVNSSTDKQDCDVLTLHSMQSVSQQDIDAGATYYNYMEGNLEVIKQALN